MGDVALADRRAKQRKERDRERAAIEDLVIFAEGWPATVAFWKTLARGLVRMALVETTKQVCQRRGIEAPPTRWGTRDYVEALRGAIEVMSPDQHRGLVVELVAYGARHDREEHRRDFFCPLLPRGDARAKAEETEGRSMTMKQTLYLNGKGRGGAEIGGPSPADVAAPVSSMRPLTPARAASESPPPRNRRSTVPPISRALEQHARTERARERTRDRDHPRRRRGPRDRRRRHPRPPALGCAVKRAKGLVNCPLGHAREVVSPELARRVRAFCGRVGSNARAADRLHIGEPTMDAARAEGQLRRDTIERLVAALDREEAKLAISEAS